MNDGNILLVLINNEGELVWNGYVSHVPGKGEIISDGGISWQVTEVVWSLRDGQSVRLIVQPLELGRPSD